MNGHLNRSYIRVYMRIHINKHRQSKLKQGVYYTQVYKVTCLLNSAAEVDFEPLTVTIQFNRSRTDATVTMRTIEDIRLESDMFFSVLIFRSDLLAENSNILFLSNEARVSITDDDGMWCIWHVHSF